MSEWTPAGDVTPPQHRCQGAGEIEVGTKQDSFGNWDTETYTCPGCPDCQPCPECGGSGSGEVHPGASVPAPCGACNGSGVDGRSEFTVHVHVGEDLIRIEDKRGAVEITPEEARKVALVAAMRDDQPLAAALADALEEVSNGF